MPMHNFSSRHVMLLLLLLGYLPQLSWAQVNRDSVNWQGYAAQGRNLLGFVEYLFNTIGSPESPIQEKRTIINQSYLKVFQDADVQIEDDLIESRSTVVHKDIQAYLKDIDFFFEEVSIQYNPLDIQFGFRENGMPYMLFETERTLKGINYEGRPVDNQQIRYVEINIDLEQEELKVVSMYSNPFPQPPQLEAWWEQLTPAWKKRFAPFMFIEDTLSFAKLQAQGYELKPGATLFFDRSTPIIISDSATLSLFQLVGRKVEIGDTALLGDYDTLTLTPTVFGRAVSQLLNRESLDFSNETSLREITPLALFARLRELNLSGTSVRSLFPLRQLSRLERLDISYTPVENLDFLSYMSGIQDLSLDGTRVRSLDGLEDLPSLLRLSAVDVPLVDISALSKHTALQSLNLSQTRVASLVGIENLKSLTRLSLASSLIQDITALSSLSKLQTLDVSFTNVKDLSPLTKLPRLSQLKMNGTAVKQIDFVQTLPSLTLIEADLTDISPAAWARATQARTELMVVYKTGQLNYWWEQLPSNWRRCLARQVQEINFKQALDPISLHRLVRIDSLSITAQDELKDFGPLQVFEQIKVLDARGSQLVSLQPLFPLQTLRKLYLNRTPLDTLAGIQVFTQLTHLNVDQTFIKDLSLLANLPQLEWLSIRSTRVSSLEGLAALPRLRRVEADDAPLTPKALRTFGEENPNTLLIYRTERLLRWWALLSESWQRALKSQLPGEEVNTDWLHRLTSLSALALDQADNLTNLRPLQTFRRLTHLSIRSTGLETLTGLESMLDLLVLDMSQNPIQDLAPLRSLSQLQELYVTNTAVGDLEPVANITGLQRLNCAGTQISDLKALSPLIELVYLNCSNTQINSLKPLSQHGKLRQLECFNTRINERKITQFREAYPQCKVVFY